MSNSRKIFKRTISRRYGHADKIFKSESEWQSDTTVYPKGVFLMPKNIIRGDSFCLKISNGILPYCKLHPIYLEYADIFADA